ncbi:hypothetical protein DPMN_037630 [Dreissena polymorpha]|uniref:Uncharacterized protein n=1 Tax=Dreissena polymorpha TaxID=45954 RepID=A0A9D4MD38_DREPO|nr:hypothetical protein DPMN_037630 [Dreissena polymorpha]
MDLDPPDEHSSYVRGSSGLMVGRWLRDRDVPGSNPALTTEISLSKKFIPHLLLSTQCFEEEGLPSLYVVALRDILPLDRRYR